MQQEIVAKNNKIGEVLVELNIFNININIDNKNREEVSEFIKELSDYLEKDNERQVSILDRVQNSEKVTVMYRDKMYIERNKILNNYAKENQDNGTMYYIYNKNLETDTYLLSICEEGKSNIVIEANENELPERTSLDTVLRKEKGKYIVDTRATFIIRKQIEEMVNKMLKEQEKYLQSNRLEGHTYEVGEIERDRVWLYDITKNNVNGIEAFEEIEFPLELINKVTEGTKVVYRNGRYEINM